MPNHCYNTFTIYGTPKELAKVKAFVKTKVPKATPAKELVSSLTEEVVIKDFDFNAVKPYPKKFAMMDKNGEEETKKGNWGFKNGFNSGGYDWCCKNWGTKWNSYDGEGMEEEDDYLRYSFTTAWSPPTPIFEAISKKFPSLEIETSWTEEGGMEGEHNFLGGETTYEESHESEREEEEEEVDK